MKRSIPFTCLSVLFALGIGAAQPPIEEEEEGGPPKPAVPKRIDQPEQAEPEPAGDPADLAAAAGKARTPLARETFKRMARPFDRLVLANGSTRSVEPVARRWSEFLGPTVTVIPLGQAGVEGAATEIKTSGLRQIVSYEEVALEEVDSLLAMDLSTGARAGANRMTRLEQLEIAEKLLAAALRFHRAALETNRRTGEAWKELGRQLDAKLREVRTGQFDILVEDQEWDRAGEMAIRLGGDYPGDQGVLRDIYRLQLEKATFDAPANTGSDEPFLDLREAMTSYRRLPGVAADDPLIRAAEKKIRDRAKLRTTEAKRLMDDGKGAEALQRLLDAERLDPDLKAVGDLRGSLKVSYPILYVGMHGLPERISPAVMSSDADRRAVELVFESLLEAVPHPQLGREYVPTLAERMPAMVPMGRAYRLRPGVVWAGNDAESREPFDARDVRGTVELYKAKDREHTWAATRVAAVAGVAIDSPTRPEVKLVHGVLDPLAAMDFKILPARWLNKNGIDPFGERFYANPVGTGPYRYTGRAVEADGRACAVFQANPFFGQRPGQVGKPRIQEIRFFDATGLSELERHFAEGRLHVLLDVPTRDLSGAKLEGVRTYTVSDHRKIHLLAVNHRRGPMRDADLRRGLALAIDRGAILDDFFRGGDKEAHRPMTGPFPPNAWATPEDAEPLLDEDLARALLRKGDKPVLLELVYPVRDPQAGSACLRIKESVERLSRAGEDDPPAVKVELVGLTDDQLRERVEGSFDYDLAYHSFEYADELYRLAPLFDPAATRAGERNYMAYPAESSDPGDRPLMELLNRTPTRREFGVLKAEMAEVHELFRKRMPFIPLWHLDRNFAVHQSVEIGFGRPTVTDAGLLDPGRFFTDVETWGLK